jgi:cytochrome c oxidase subunit 2
MISWYVTQASSYAADVDNLFLLIALIVGAFFLAAEFVLLWLIVKFRARPGVKARYITGEKASETRWVNYPHYLVLVFDILIVAAALRVWSDVKIDLPPAEERVRIIAQQWAWTFVHAGPDGQLDTADDIRTVNVLNLQVNRLYHYELHSKDVLHSFSVPAFRLKQDAVPGRAIVGWFRPTVIGEFDLQCAEICGIGHGLMPGRVRIRSAAAQSAWMETAPRMPQLPSVTPAVPATGAPASLAARGATLRVAAGPKGLALQTSTGPQVRLKPDTTYQGGDR